jgi:lysyl-tRNA synthetase class 2
MSHIVHLSKNKKNLEYRFRILKLIRRFFESEQFTEVDAPEILALPGQEPNLQPMKVVVLDENKHEHVGYLHTSPEYVMKKMLTVGWDKIYYLGKCYRNQESFGGTHNPEFTMIEWYRTQVNYEKLMSDIEALWQYCVNNLPKLNIADNLKQPWKRVTMKELWQEKVGVNLDEYLTTESMRRLVIDHGYNPGEHESYEELFYRIFLNKIEAQLGFDAPTIVCEYPAVMASLSKLTPDGKYAERFEAYINGIELANAFSELTDADEQLKRLVAEKEERARLGLDVFEVDNEFVEALRAGMPQSTGIALGVDRLIMLLLACSNINDVLVLPMSKLFNE